MSRNRNDESVMTRDYRAYRDTEGMTNPERTVFWMEKLGIAHMRGRGDTLGASVQRVAVEIGAPVSQAKRCWDRWKEMKSVDGAVMIPFMLAYEELCRRIEAQAEEYERQRLQLRTSNDAAVESPVPAGAGVVGAAARKEA